MSWEPTGQFVDHNPVVEKGGKFMVEYTSKSGDRYKVPLEKELQDAMFPPSAPASAAGADPLAPPGHFSATFEAPSDLGERVPTEVSLPTVGSARRTEVSLDPAMTIGGVPDLYTTMEPGDSTAWMKADAPTASEEPDLPAASDPETGTTTATTSAAAPDLSAAAEAAIEEGKLAESEPSEDRRKRERVARIEATREATARKARFYGDRLAARLYKQRSASMMRKHGFTFTQEGQGDYPIKGYPTTIHPGLAAETTPGGRKSWFAAQVTSAGRPVYQKVKSVKTPQSLYASGRTRYPPMRSQQGPARRRNPIRINDNILRAEEDARARWGWYRAEDVYVTT